MRTLWQALIAILVLIGLTNMLGGLVNVHDTGTFGLSGQPATLHANSVYVESVTPQSPAADANVRGGDTLSFDPSFENRVMILAPIPGDSVRFRDDARTFTLTAARDNGPVPWALITLIDLAKLAFLSIAVVVAWRRPDDSAARALAFFLACFGAALSFDYALVPSVFARFTSFLFVQSAFLAGALGTLAFACRFPSTATSGLRLAASRLIVPLAIAGYTVTIVSFATAFTPPNRSLAQFVVALYVAIYVIIVACTFAALIDSYRNAVREQRPRMRWVMGTLAVGFSGVIVLFIGLLFAPRTPWLQYIGLTILAVPFGLGYVIFRHRVIDIGFVINRAVVYTGVSLVVVGGFIVFEWLLGHVVEANSRASSIIQLSAALVLGLSVRFIHARVDRYVDDVFFRDRHLAEAAIRRFAHETGLITDSDILVRRTVEIAERNGRFSGVAFFARSAASYVPLFSTFERTPATIDENDEAILAMRAWHNPVDIERTSAVPGLSAFPMLVRGLLAGFLACGEKTTHEALAPDEREALHVLARDAGIALDSLRITRIERELGYLTADSELPPTLRTRLSTLLDNEDLVQPAGAAARSSQ